MRICFFANLSQHANWREMFEKVEFYRVDIELLRSLGHEVVLAGTPRGIDWSADLYYGWWWGHAPFLLPPAKLRRRPLIVTGAFDYATCREELPGLCYLDRPAWQRTILSSMLRLADANLFISQYEFNEVTDNLKVRNPVSVPLAIDTDLCIVDDAASPGDYYFTVSLQSRENAVRKGLPQAIEAFARVARERPETRLIIAGKRGDYTATLAAQAEALGVGDRVEFPGMISTEDKLRAFRECIAYVQPTLYEGFGHAVGEALACGADVVAASRGAVPEVTGGLAQIVDPKDVDAIADAMLACAANRADGATRHARHNWIVSNFGMNVRRERLRRVISDVTGR
ncbi:glycosyltransferase [Sphingopyxis sp.]|uniref:glycosyltransferase n=1 Tax=Sphingopyxis sp. TaxID=1908224 RepID=UPI0035AE9298